MSPGYSFATFASSPAFRWLSASNYENAKRHGFVPSYPPAAGPQGPNPEPWEYLYISTDSLQSLDGFATIDAYRTTKEGTQVIGWITAPDAELHLYVDEVEHSNTAPDQYRADVEVAIGTTTGLVGFTLVALEHHHDTDVCVVATLPTATDDVLIGCQPRGPG